MSSHTQPSPFRARHASGLHAVARELGDLHRAMLRTGGEEPHAVRLSVLTLVAACVDRESADVAAGVVAAIAARHPARAIVVTADRRGADVIEADLSLQSVGAAGSDQVCLELVRLEVGGETAGHLASVLEPLLLPDVPVALWLVGAVPLAQALRPDTLDLCERIIVDSDAFSDVAAVLGELAGAVRTEPLGDLAWARTRTWREVVAHAFDDGALRPFLAGAETVTVRAGRPAAGWLLGGWLCGRLAGADLATPRVVVTSGGDGAPAGIEAVGVRCATHGRTAEVVAALEGDAVVVTMKVGGDQVGGRTVPVEHPGLEDLVGGLIEQAANDPVYADALHRAADLATR